MAKSRLVGKYPVIGIRPTIDGRRGIIDVRGSLEKQTGRGEKILNFSQSYYLDEKLLTDKIAKEKSGDKYIITIPFKD